MKHLFIFLLAFISFFSKTHAQSISLISPTTTATWQQGSFKEIKWNAVNVPYVDVMVSLNGGSSYSLVQASVPSTNGMILYSPSGVNGTQAIFKVKSSTNPNIVSSASPVITFSSSATANTINSPSLAPSYCTGRTFTVSYTATGAYQSGNTFMLISSDNSGDFTNAIQLGKVTTTVTSGVITCKFPEDYIPHPINNTLMLVSDMPSVQSNPVTATVTNFSAAITSPSTTIYSQDPVNQNFTSTHTGAMTSYTWSFGDGNSANTQNTSHSYFNYGNYSVSLRMINATGCTQLVRKPYLVNIDPLFGSVATVPANPVFDANDVRFLNKDTAVAVGKGGMVWQSIDGANSWSVMPTFTGTKSNNAVYVKNRYICIAGDSGTVTFSNDRGATWANSSQAQPLTNYKGVHFADTTFGAAVGELGDAVIYKWVGGLGWSHIPTGLTQNMNAVWAYKTSTSIFTDGDAMAVGDQGKITKYAFGSWTNAISPTTLDLKAIFIYPNNLDVLVSGANGLIMRSPDYGVTWNVIQNGTPEALNDITLGPKPNQVIIVGDNGVIYESLDNGFTFTRYTSGFPNSRLNGTSSKSPKGAFAGSGGTLRQFGTDSVKLLPIAITNICPGNSLKVRFNLMGTAFTPTFTANLVLSDNTGNFLNSVVLNSKTNPTNLDSIIATIPDNLPASANYKVRIELSGNNSLYSQPSIENITIKQAPNATTLTISGAQILATSQPSCTYQWYYNNGIMSGQTTTTVTTTGNGYYKIVVTNTLGCTKSDSIQFNNTGLEENILDGFLIYPNPANKVLNVKLSASGKHNLTIYNALGKAILNKEIISAIDVIDIENLKAGIYFVYLKDESGNKISVTKFIKQ